MTTRLLRGTLIALLAIGSLAIWIAIPAGWLWVTRDISAGARFLIVIGGCIASMFGAAALLYRLEDVLERTGGAPERPPSPQAWLRPSSGARGPKPPPSLLDVFLVASAVIAAAALVVWWAFFADSSNPSGPLQPL